VSSLPVLLVRHGFDLVPVLAGSDPKHGLVGYDLVRGELLSYSPGDVIGAVNVDPAAVYWGLELDWKAAEQRLAAETGLGCGCQHAEKLLGTIKAAEEDRGRPSTDVVPLATTRRASRGHRRRQSSRSESNIHEFVATFLRNVEGAEKSDWRDWLPDPRVETIADVLESIDITDIDEILGAGSFGTAASVGGDTVVKLTSDASEVQAGFVLVGAKLAHVAAIDVSNFIRGVRVNAIVDIDKREQVPVGVLVTEQVDTLEYNDDAEQLSKFVEHFKEEFQVWPHQLFALPPKEQRARLERASRSLATLLHEQANDLRYQGDNDEAANMCDGIASGVQELRSKGVYDIDVHAGNVGFVEDVDEGRVYKIFDIGSSSSPAHPKATAIGDVRSIGRVDVASLVSEGAPRASWIGEGVDALEGGSSSAREEAARRIKPEKGSYGALGYKFAPMPSPLFGGAPIVTGFPEVRSTLLRHRNQLPTLETIRLSTIFAGTTIRTSIKTAEKAFECIVDMFKAHGRQFATIDEIRGCMKPLGLFEARSNMYRTAEAWAPTVLAEMKSGLQDRELRRKLFLESELPEGIGAAKLSFILALLGQNTCCLDGRLLSRMFGSDEAMKVAGTFSKKTELSLKRYEEIEDAFLKGNPFYRPSDPIGRARSQWLSWESVGGAPTSHSAWLRVVA
jgi:hypothetical protein